MENEPSAGLLADWAWIFELGVRGLLSSYQGRYIAVIGKKIVATGENEPELRVRVATEFGVDSERVALFYNDGPEE